MDRKQKTKARPSRANEVISSTETRQLRPIVVGQLQARKNSFKDNNNNNKGEKIPKRQKT